ncbi:plasmid mobilization protein [Streptomyces capparidis]
MAEAFGRQGTPDQNGIAAPADPLPRAADEAALHRVARRRRRDAVQRNERITTRFSREEDAAIRAEARALNIAVSHFVGAVIMAHLAGDVALPGQRTKLDDYIDELNALRTQVAKIGGNVNQIAHRLNAGGHPHPGDNALLAQTGQLMEVVGAAVTSIAAATNSAVNSKAA